MNIILIFISFLFSIQTYLIEIVRIVVKIVDLN